MPTPTAVEITLFDEERDRLKARARRPKTRFELVFPLAAVGTRASSRTAMASNRPR